jgi:hypothetical protein
MAVSGRMSENLPVLGALDPVAGVTDATSDWCPIENHSQFLAIALVGVTDSSTVITLQQATDGSGTGAADISGYTDTIGSTDDNQQVVYGISASELLSTTTHIALHFDCTGGSNAYRCGVILGGDARYSPNTSYDAASVTKIYP